MIDSQVVRLSTLLRRKVSVREELASKLNRKERKEALRDGHAIREPRPCGLTVHPGRGCSYGCLYCYIWDTGVPTKPEPYGLDGLQLTYAIASNPYTLVGEDGTFLAFGSITEPFLPRIVDKTLEYLGSVKRYLGNPSQFSTKSHLKEDQAKFIASIDPSVSALITIPVLKWAAKLEPNAPPPELRFETIRNLLDAGLHVALFMRPLIPGISEVDGPEILKRAAQLGVKGIIFGGLRVTKNILVRLKGIGLSGLETRMLREPKGPRDQVPIDGRVVKELLVNKAEELNLKVYPSACSANVSAHHLGCRMCSMGPCGGPIPEYDPEEVEQALAILGIDAKVVPRGPKIVVYLRKVKVRNARKVKYLVSTATKRMVGIRRLR